MSFLRLRLVLRSYMRHRLLFALNLFSLIIGLVVCFLIGIFVTYELGFDREIPEYQRIYRVFIYGRISDLPVNYAVTMLPLGKNLTETFPEIESAVTLQQQSGSRQLAIGDKTFRESDILPVLPGFCALFGFPVIAGSPDDLLKEPNTIVLTRSIAEKFFGEGDPLGKTIRIDNRIDYTVTGIVADPPENMHFTFTMLTPMEGLDLDDPQLWGRFGFYTYVKVAENVDPVELEAKIKNFAMEKMEMEPGQGGMEFNLGLQPIKDIHLHSHLEYDMALTGNINYVNLFTAIGIFILALACINFAMLITANASIRNREIGVSKVYGASRMALIWQFLRESLLLSIVAAILSVIIILVIYPFFTELTGYEQMFARAMNWEILAAGFILVLLTGFFAGLYPALYLSGADPVPILKGFIGGHKKSGGFRNLLTLFQFSISIALISGTLAIYHQLRFIRNTDLGFKKENTLFAVLNVSNIHELGSRVKEEFGKITGVRNVSLSTGFPGAGACTGGGMHPEGMDDEAIVMIKWIDTDPEFLDTYEIQMVEGDPIPPEQFPDDVNILVNQSLVKDLGWDNPIGMKIADQNRRNEAGERFQYNVVGVFKDFHIRSFRESIEPLVLFMRNTLKPVVNISIEENGREETLERLKKKWEELEPGMPFNYSFVEDHFNELHTYEMRLGSIFSWFSGLAVMIACLGLFGLASFALKNRIKEIGVRKVLGSTNQEIAFILSRDFIKWVLLANIIAIPISWYGIRQWIRTFSFHASLSPWIFVISALIVIFISFVTILYHTIRAARMNPAEALKYE